MENDLIRYYIGHATDETHRYKASSGGIGTLLQKYLLESNQYGTSLTFRFNEGRCMYEPIMIYKAEDVNICGSIYQDIDILKFVHNHLSDIKNGIIVSCSPCQVNALKILLTKSNIPHFVISYCCSGQTTIEGTWKYYDFLGIKKENVKKMQYRGNGWPSGIQIQLRDGTKIYRGNYTEPWNIIHKSGFFRPKRCWFCKLGTSYKSDITLGDPWLQEYVNHDAIGNSIFFANTNKGGKIIKELHQLNLIKSNVIDEEMYRMAQRTTENRRSRSEEDISAIRHEYKRTERPLFRNLFTKSFCMMKIYLYVNSKTKTIKRRICK